MDKLEFEIEAETAEQAVEIAAALLAELYEDVEVLED